MRKDMAMFGRYSCNVACEKMKMISYLHFYGEFDPNKIITSQFKNVFLFLRAIGINNLDYKLFIRYEKKHLTQKQRKYFVKKVRKYNKCYLKNMNFTESDMEYYRYFPSSGFDLVQG
jgi:hypothetical protein